MKTAKQLAPLLAAIVVLLAVFRIWVPQFLAIDNLLDLAQQISVNAILAFGMTLVILIGGIDLSVGAVVALIGTLTVWLLPQVGLVGAISAGLAAAVGSSGRSTAISRRARPPCRRSSSPWPRCWWPAARPSGSTRAGRSPFRRARRPSWRWATGGCFRVVPVPVLVMAAAFVVTAVLLHRTRFGQHLYAIGGNREAARYTGISLARNEIAVYIACSLLAGLAGMIHVSQLYCGRARVGPGFRAPRHRRGRGGRNKLHRRHRHDARHVAWCHHHRHSQQGTEPGRSPLLAPVHRQGARHPGSRLPGRTAAVAAVLTQADMAPARFTNKKNGG